MNQKSDPFDQKKEKQAAIFDAACRVMRAKGFHQARMADIAAEAGISYGLVYHYFGSKSELFDALYEEWWGPLEALTETLCSSDRPIEEKLGGIAGYFFSEYEARPDLVHIFITEFSRSSANLTPARLLRFKNLMDRIDDMIRDAQKGGTVRGDLKARYLTYLFLGGLEALLSSMVLENQPLKGSQHKQRLTDAILSGFFQGARPVRSG